MSDRIGRSLRAWLESGRRAEPGARPLPSLNPSTECFQGRYVDEGEIAHGDRVSVRRVVDLRMKRRVVMKVLDPARVRNTRDAERFDEEARIVAALEHPHAPPIYDSGQDDEGIRFFTMKLAEGRLLAEILGEPGYSPADETQVFALIEAVRRACDVVAFAHARGIFHCDLKPLNIALAPHGQVYVLDWSAARLAPGAIVEGVDAEARAQEPGWIEPSTKAHRLLPTGAYLAPEQAIQATSRIGAETDVFGLGATLYHVLAGRPPYDASDLTSLLEAAGAAQIRPPWEITRHAWPWGIGEVAMRALAKDPAARYTSVEAFARDLDASLKGEPKTEVRTFQPGALLMREGDPGDAAYVIGRGRALVFKTVDGARHPVRELGPGDLVGETAIFSDSPRTASVEAIDPVVASVVTKRTLDEELGHTRWLGGFVRALADRFRDIDKRMTAFEQKKDEADLGWEVLRAMVKQQTTLVPWMPVRVTLCRTFQRSGPDVLATVKRIPFFYVDLAKDTIALVDPDRRA